MNRFLPLLADRVFGRPLLLTESKLEIIFEVLGGRIGLAGVDTLSGDFDAPTPEASGFAGRKSDRGPYRVTSQGIAIVPIQGSLVNRGAYIGASSGLTSYEGITEQLKRAEADSDVRAILLDMDTPGGEAAGTFDVSRQIMEIRKKKPVIAWVNAMAASAGYAIASAASQIYTTETGMLGSIGVIWAHFDRSKKMEMDGIKPTLLHAGDRKAEGNPFEPLSAETRANIQAELDKLYDIFVETVAAGRPGLKPSVIRKTQAAVFMGRDAVKLGLADDVSTFDRVLEVVSKEMSKSPTVPAGYDVKPTEKADMSENQAAQPASAPDTAALDAARSEGRSSEKTRLSAILALPEANGRTDQAIELATGSDLSVEACARILAKAPEAAAPVAPASETRTSKIYDAVAASGGKPNLKSAGEVGQTRTQGQEFVASMKRRVGAPA